VFATGLAFAYSQSESTSFDIQLATPPPLQMYQFQFQNEAQTLMSAGNVYYDADLDCIPQSAYEIVDQFGDPLGPYIMQTDTYEEYVLDITPVLSGQGLHPYFRGVELTNASQRAWRLDWYKDGTGGNIYTTVMSGPVLDLGGGNYQLTVDLGLRWSENGDALNRLQQGRFSHIALAIGDFRSFGLTIDLQNQGSAQLVANVFSVSPTVTPTKAPGVVTTPAPIPELGYGDDDNDSPTAAPGVDRLGETAPPSYDGELKMYPPPGVAAWLSGSTYAFGAVVWSPITNLSYRRIIAGAGFTDPSADTTNWDIAEDAAESGKKGKSKGKSGDSSQNRGEDGCDGHGKGKKGKGKKGKGKGKKGQGCKHGKMSFEDLNMSNQEGGLMVGATAGIFLIAGWALVVHRQRQAQQDGYEAVEEVEEIPTPTIPTAFAAFGSFSAEQIKEQAKMMRVVPVE